VIDLQPRCKATNKYGNVSTGVGNLMMGSVEQMGTYGIMSSCSVNIGPFYNFEIP